MRAINDKIIIKVRPVENRTKAGIMLDNTSRPKYALAEVISVGHKVRDIKVGDIINYDTHAAMKLDDEQSMIRDIDAMYIT